MAMPACSVHKLVADVAVLSDNLVLLVRYRDVRKYDNQVGWFLPDDYLVHGEHPDAAAERILWEQIGLRPKALRLAFLESFGGHGEPWHLVFHYAVRMKRRPATVSGANVVASHWFNVRDLPPRGELAHGGWTADVLAEVLRRVP
jgi:ADP-ribose pyrophosphatase YjhB (NUDIX family)